MGFHGRRRKAKKAAMVKPEPVSPPVAPSPPAGLKSAPFYLFKSELDALPPLPDESQVKKRAKLTPSTEIIV